MSKILSKVLLFLDEPKNIGLLFLFHLLVLDAAVVVAFLVSFLS